MSKTKSWLWDELEQQEQEPFSDYVEQFNAKSISRKSEHSRFDGHERDAGYRIANATIQRIRNDMRYPRYDIAGNKNSCIGIGNAIPCPDAAR